MSIMSNPDPKQDSIGDVPWKPIYPPHFFDPRHTNIALIILTVMNDLGMGPLQDSMVKIVKEQKIADGVNSDFIQISSLLTQIEQDAGPDGMKTIPQALIDQLKGVMQKLFGDGKDVKFDTNGKIIPTADSDFGKFIQMLKDKGEDPADNSIYNLVQSFAGKLNGNIPDNTQTSAPLPDNKFLEDLLNGDDKDIKTWLNVMGSNYYYSNNPTKDKIGSPNYVSDFFNLGTAVQGGLTSAGSVRTAMMQTYTTQMNAYDQIGQNTISAMISGFEKTAVDNQKV
jgi:hypothetical protein